MPQGVARQHQVAGTHPTVAAASQAASTTAVTRDVIR